jgi:hypothetical protein
MMMVAIITKPMLAEPKVRVLRKVPDMSEMTSLYGEVEIVTHLLLRKCTEE